MRRLDTWLGWGQEVGGLGMGTHIDPVCRKAASTAQELSWCSGGLGVGADGGGSRGRGGPVHIADSHCCTLETSTLSSNWPSIKKGRRAFF